MYHEAFKVDAKERKEHVYETKARSHLKKRVQELNAEHEEHHRLTVLNRLILVYKPSETVSEVLERYEDECQAIEDLVLEKRY